MSMHRALGLSVLVLQFVFLGLAARAQTPTIAAGTTPGEFSVTSSGAASYRIPIQVPPGVAGMEPKLELVYNSRRGNGLLGVGWGLGGLSAITRCPRTMAQDGFSGKVSYDNNDRYCLDGQRLILVSGAYGSPGSEYRTELDTFSKVTAVNAAGSGPQYFVVRTKAGLVMEYGNTTDSRVEVLAGTTVRTWAVNRMSDVKTNYMTFSYVEVNASGQHYPSRIDYAGNTATGRAPASSIQFVTEARPDAPAVYHNGSVMTNVVRIKTIQTFTDAAALKEYRLAYGVGTATGRSRLSQVQACVAATCLPPIALGSADTLNRFSSYSTWSTGHSASDKLGDFNGDGKTDVIQVDSSGNAKVWLSTGSGFLPGTVWSTGISQTYQLGDFDGDGKTDIVQLDANSLPRISLSTGSGFLAAAAWGTQPVATYQLGDFDGDGRTDLFRVGSDGYAYVWLSTGSSFLPSTAWGTAVSPTSSYKVGDFNGDGKADVFRMTASGYAEIRLSTGSAFQTSNWSLGSYGGTSSDILGDFNGDGKTDLMRVASGGKSTVLLSTGSGFAPGTLWGYSHLSTDKVADINGDGKADVVQTNANGNSYVWLSTGSSFVPYTQWSTGHLSTDKLGDFNGDGKTDVIQTNANGNAYVWLSDGPMPDLLMQVDNNQDLVTSITSKALTDNTIYTKDTGVNAAVYPKVDLQLPLYVVSLVQQSDGVGGVLTSQYTYGGLKAELGTGRGLLGFRWVKSKDLDTAMERSTEYSQQWPYAGIPVKNETSLAGLGNAGLLKRTTATPACQDPQTGAACAVAAGNRYFPYLATSIEESWDLSGIAYPGTSRTTVYGTDTIDGKAYGDPTLVTVTNSDGSTRATANIYWPVDAANWVLGRLKRTTVTSTTSNVAPGSGGGSGAEALALSVSPNAVSNVDVAASAMVMNAVVTPIATGGSPGYTFVWQRVGAGVLTMNTDSNGVLTVSGSVAVNQAITERYRVTVTDHSGAQTSEEVPLNFTLYAQAPLALNVTPTSTSVERASTGTATTGASVTASGGVGPYAYNWARVAGARTVITNATTAAPTFTATVGWGENFTETMRVTVTDGIGGTSYRDMTVRYWAPAALAAVITTTPASITVGCGDGMLYSFTSSVAARGAYPPYLYTWLVTLSGSWYEGIQSVAPGGSAASITLRQANGPGGQAYWSGPILYPYQVRVTDSRGNITTSGGIITVNGGCAYVEPPQIGFRFDNSPPALVQFSSMAPVGLAKS